MCAIAGILRTGEDARDEGALGAMQAALAHRGPDDAGTWRSRGGEALFAHNRLSIIDLTPAGHQPMSSADGRLTIAWNGEIYNHAQLRESLSANGAAFRTRSDTEVILRAYEAHGTGCLAMLRGMFALAIWDEASRSCLLARDPLGIKPIYYHAGPGRLAFASELRALVRSGAVPTTLDPEGVFGYLRFGSVREPATLLSAVRSLEPGHWMRWHEGALESQRYWQLAFAPAAATDAMEAARSTRAALLDSVRHHFVSDVPVGLFLSGGMDSTALLALARASGHADVRTFSISFPGLPQDEGELARRTARHFGARHDDWPIEAGEARALLDDFASSMDQPSIDGMNTLAVSRFARRHGVKVVLSGLGGDELFAGYKSFRQVPRMTRWHRRIARVGPARRGLERALSRSARPQWRRLGEMLGESPALGTSYAALRAIFTRSEAARLASAYVEAPPPSVAGGEAREDADERDAVSRLELTGYLRNQLLRDADVNSMACGLELRVPLLDAVLVSTLARIPAGVRLRPGKRLLLEAVPEIPEWVARRPKRGFLFPFERWLRDEWRGAFAEQERRSPVPLQTWYQKWSVFMLERWVEGLR